MILLRLISWPYFRKHRLSSLLTTAGIVLGVALLVGMQTANRSVLRAFNHTVERIAGKTQLQVSAGDSGFSEDVLERVQSVPEVRAASPVIEASVDTGIKGQGKLLILGAGDEQAFEACRPVFASFASDIFHLGPAGAGQLLELAREAVVGLAGQPGDVGFLRHEESFRCFRGERPDGCGVVDLSTRDPDRWRRAAPGNPRSTKRP